MDCQTTIWGSIPSGDSVKPELHIDRKGQLMWVPSLNDLAVDGTLKTTNQPIYLSVELSLQSIIINGIVFKIRLGNIHLIIYTC